MKYFNFLLENEINFTRDETGHYVALVKVLNPQFYGEQQKEVQNKQDYTKDKLNLDPLSNNYEKPRSSSQINRDPKSKLTGKNNLRSKSPIGGKNPLFEKATEKKVLHIY